MKMSTAYMQRKEFLSFIRDGDYAHAGGEESIELVMCDFEKQPTRSILDVGSGLGGTAHYLQEKGWGKVCGIDIEADAIAYAKQKYPDIEFSACDVNHAHNKFAKDTFDLLISFNAFFSFHDQLGALRSLAETAKPNADLILFDYSCSSEHIPDNPFKGGSVTSFYPLNPKTNTNLFGTTGWKVKKNIDISMHFLKWYGDFLSKMESVQDEAIIKFGTEEFNRMYLNFERTYQLIESGELGGAIVYAVKG